ncbi:MAG: hypothetical protein E7021_04135 [Alphaproteobacteria bacterium]|nr:hypothetical protein [Alphaproteobacteria bacterium]
MKNFLQVLLVGTILVSAGDGFSYVAPDFSSDYWSQGVGTPNQQIITIPGYIGTSGAPGAAAAIEAARAASANATGGAANATGGAANSAGGVALGAGGSGSAGSAGGVALGAGGSGSAGSAGGRLVITVEKAAPADLTGESFTDYGSHGSFSSVSGTRLEAQLDGTYLDPATNYTYTVENGSLVRVGGSASGSGSGWDYSNVEGGDGFDWGNAGPGNQGGSGASGTDWDNLDTDSPHLYGDDVASGGSGGGAALGSGAGVSGDALGGISQGIAGSIGAGLSNVGATFGNYFDTLTGTLTKPFSIIKGLWDDAGGTIGDALGSIKEGFVQLPGNVKAIFGAGDKILSGTSAVDSLLKAQGVDASKLTAKQQAALATKIAQAFPILIWNYGEYATVIMQTLEAGKQNDTTKEVKVKAENALLASQGASTDSTVGKNVSLQGTNLASAASQMALLLDANPVDLNLLKTNDLDLKKDKDQKTLRQRRDLLLQMYATSAQIIAEGSNDISEKFYERIEQLSESLPGTVGSLGSASVLNDSERYPYFEMIRQTALTATQLGLKGASILPNLRIVAPKSQEQ